MKVLKFITLLTVFLLTVNLTNAQVTSNTKDTKEVKAVMKAYKDAIQNLTTEGTFELFTPDAIIFEQGKLEGTYKEYISHHLGHFKSFIFSDYEIQTTVNSSYAYTTENYIYTIVLKGNKTKDTKERTIKSKGVATSILQKIDGKWKIIHSHTSFKKLKI